MNNVLIPIAKSVSAPLGQTASASARDVAVQKTISASGRPGMLAKQTTLVFSNKKIDDIMKIVKSLEKSGITR